jgi:hypothetical protein
MYDLSRLDVREEGWYDIQSRARIYYRRSNKMVL